MLIRYKEPIPLKDHVDINLTSVISFTRIALAYMKSSKDPEGSAPFSKSLCLVSSIAGITEAPGLFSYSPSKHGVIGLMRALRPWAPVRYGVRANAICPWATDTQLFAPGLRDAWNKENLPMNQPHDVGKIIVHCTADQALNGTAVFVTGGKYFDTEEGIDRTLPQWMGEKNAKEWLTGQDLLGLVSQYYAQCLELSSQLTVVCPGRQMDRMSRDISPLSCSNKTEGLFWAYEAGWHNFHLGAGHHE